MPAQLQYPLIYPITSGATTTSTTTDDQDFAAILSLVENATDVQIPIIQLREKELTARVLYQLTQSAVNLTKGSATRILVNNRFDIALSAGAAGVHLTSQSINTAKVRAICGDEFLIGVSTHSLEEAQLARAEGADFVVFGPVFDTESKRSFGRPQGVEELRRVVSEVQDFPVVAIGGVELENVDECFLAGARGIAAIHLLNDVVSLPSIVAEIRRRFNSQD